MAEARDGESGKLIWWVLGVLLTLTLAAGGWWAKDLQQRFDHAQTSTAQKIETLHQTNALRGERMVAIETKLASAEPRVTALEAKFGAVEPRLPLLEARLTGLETRLGRIEEKIDAIGQRLSQARGGAR
jgi:hypothetical protein